jgi:hypothetical protein
MRPGRALYAMICLIVLNGVTSASVPRGASLPPNLIAAAILQPTLERMWQSSPTFRRQCKRLAGASYLRVTLSLEELSRRPSHRARATFKHLNGRLVSVDVQLTIFDAPVELVAHEIEHVIAQLDGADLELHVRTGAVWKDSDGSFETRRATAVGRRVASEMGLSAATPEPIPAQHQPWWQPLLSVVQQEPFATVHDSPSGRVSGNGRYVVFASRARLSPADGNTSRDIYVFDLSTRQGTLETPGRSTGTRRTERASTRTSATTAGTSFSSPSRGISRTSNYRQRRLASTGEIANWASRGCSRRHRAGNPRTAQPGAGHQRRRRNGRIHVIGDQPPGRQEYEGRHRRLSNRPRVQPAAARGRHTGRTRACRPERIAGHQRERTVHRIRVGPRSDGSSRLSRAAPDNNRMFTSTFVTWSAIIRDECLSVHRAATPTVRALTRP